MAYAVAIDDVDGVIRVEVRGKRTPGRVAEDARLLWTRIADECLERKTNRVLIVSHLKGPLSTPEAYEIGAKMPAPQFGHLLVIAHVNLDPGSLAGAQFVETVAGNRGWTIRVFDNEADAWRWIKTTPRVQALRPAGDWEAARDVPLEE
jgi:hypothetical protein